MPQSTRAVAEKMAARGDPHPVIARRPTLLEALSPVLDAFHELDRDPEGRPLLSSMRQMLDELGIAERTERDAWRGHWWALWQAEVEVERERQARREALRKAKLQGGSEEGRGGHGPVSPGGEGPGV